VDDIVDAVVKRLHERLIEILSVENR